ncbi:MAG: sulfite exporter TauE/SafE family protein [Anaerolineales bacterium]|nr:sulfite exporter TauE/SafE family protein [Anaerolineales bacterium]
MTVDPIFIAALALAAFLTGLSKGGLGGTMGVLITPMTSLVMPMEQAIGLLLPILMLGDVFALAAHWNRWDRQRIWVLLAGALLGVTLGTFILANLPSLLLRRGLGVLVMIFVTYRLLERRILGVLHYQARRWHAVLAGSVAGFTSTLAHAGGPPITIYLLMQDLQPSVFVATSVLFFATVNWIKVPYYFYAGLFDFETLLKLAWLAPLVPLGVWLGKRLVERVDKAWFERIIIALLLITGTLLLAR